MPCPPRADRARRSGNDGPERPLVRRMPMAGRLTTHVLDIVHGRPAAGIAIELFRINPDGDVRERLTAVRTNADGRTDGPLLSGDALETGYYELVFSVGD